jgi:hypothetical protein
VGYVEDLRGKKQGRGRPRWRARWRDPAGRERSKSFARKVDAERFLVGIEDAKLRGAYVDPAAGKVPFSEWAERWYSTTAALRHTTRRDYRKLLDQQVLPALAVDSLGPMDAWGRPEDGELVEVVASWAYPGAGYATEGEAWLALSAAARARERRRLAREECFTTTVTVAA